MTAQPADGTAVILHLIEAVRHWKKFCEIDPPWQHEITLKHWVEELERRLEREVPETAPVSWEPRTWGELCQGDRVSVGGVEAEVVAPVMVLRWHVDPNRRKYVEGLGYVNFPLEHSTTRVKLSFREEAYDMPTGGEVETLRGPLGQERDRAAGRGRAGLEEDRAAVLGHWVDEAAQTLEAAGLGPVEVLR